MNIVITAPDGDTRTYAVPHTGLLVKDGDVIEAGHQLTYGALNPHEVLRIRGADAVYNYLIQEVLRVYRQQGVDINDKHIEIIVRQMMRKVRLEDAGDTKLLDGSMVDVLELDDANEEIDRRNAAGERQGRASAPRRRHPAADGHHEGISRHGLLPVRRLLPGDHQGPDGGRHQGQGRPSGGPEGECHHRQADPCRHGPDGLPHLC